MMGQNFIAQGIKKAYKSMDALQNFTASYQKYLGKNEGRG